MFPRFSVKRPYTILVGVIMILILGFISVTEMTADLLPSIELPYSVVYTTFVGASPEEVELSVTRPVESVMATVSNIKSINSTSSENVSMVILEFEESSNMDSVNMEMREKLDQISAGWEDGIGNPLILNINPDMLPIMIAAVSLENYEGPRLSDYVNDNILSELESVEGVASVSASGGISESIEVTLSSSKLKNVNNTIRDTIAGRFRDAKEELEKARADIEEGIKKVEDGEKQVDDALKQISSGNDELAERMAQARAEVDEKKTDISNTKLALTVQLSELKSQQLQLQQTKSMVEQLKTARDSLMEQAEETKKAISDFDELVKAYNEAADALQSLDGEIAAIEANEDYTAEQKKELVSAIKNSAEYIAAEQLVVSLRAQFTAMGINDDALDAQRSQLQATLDTLTSAIEEIDKSLEPYTDDPGNLDATIAQLDEGLAGMEEARTQMEAAIEQLDSGMGSIRDAEELINKNESAAYYKIYQTMTQTMVGKQALENTRAQLESGLSQLDTSSSQLASQEEDAKAAADLTGIVTREMVGRILNAQNFALPAGYITVDQTQTLVRVGNRFYEQDELANLVVVDLNLSDVEPITLSDVADVVLVNDSDKVYANIDGSPGILLTMQKQTGYSTGEVSSRVKERFEALRKEIDGLSFKVLMDQGVYIEYVVGSVFKNLLYGACLAILILILFLRDIRPTFAIALSIPISLTAALALMYFTGISINVISLSGLALGVGMLVDNSIVVTENVYRMRSEGMPAIKAAVEGAKEVSGAILASTLTTCCVFLPIVFMEGLTKQIFADLGLTITYSLLASLIVALTVVPVLGKGLLAKKPANQNKAYGRIARIYSGIVERVLNHRVLVIVASFVMLVLSAFMAYKNGTSLFPPMEATQVTVTLTPPEGSSVAEAGELANQVIDRVMTIDDVETVGGMIGSGSAMFGMSSAGAGREGAPVTIYIVMSPDKKLTNAGIKEEILRLTDDIDCTLSINTDSADMSLMGASGVSVQISGRDLDRLNELALDFAAKLSQIEGITDVSDGTGKTTPELRIIVDKAEAIKHNLTVAQIYAAVYSKLSTSVASTTLAAESKDYPVLVLEGEARAFNPIDVISMSITATRADNSTEEVKLSDVADFEQTSGLSSIRRVDQRRTITVSAKVDDDHNIGFVGNDIERLIASYKLPDGYMITLAGENEQITSTMMDLVKMMILAIAFVYMVMVAQFQSLLMPFIIMFTLPLAFTGGFLALIIANYNLSVVAVIGLIMLTGIIVNNGIVLVDYINILRRRGMEKKEAIRTAAGLRLRPILMTSLTTILGLVTMAFGMGMGADLVQPLAVVTIGGLVYGTLTTLIVMPCMYDLISRKKDLTKVEPDSLPSVESEPATEA